MKYLFIILVLLIFVGFACSKSKEVATSTSETELMTPYKLYFNTFPCRGFCPVLKMYMDDKSVSYFDGIKHYDRVGPHFNADARKHRPDIYKRIEALDWQSFESEYPNVVMDLPSWEFIYVKDQSTKKIVGYNNLPAELKTLGDDLLAWGRGPHWERHTKEIPTHQTAKEYIGNQFIVLFKEEPSIDTWIKKYKGYNLKPIRQLSPNLTKYWLFQFDETRINRENLLEKITKDSAVESAEANREAKMRGGRSNR